MLSLLIDPEEILDEAPQPQTRQARRETIREKKRDSERRKQSKLAAEQPKAKSRKPKMQKNKPISFSAHCYQVAEMLVRVAVDIDQLANEEDKWFEGGHDGLVNALAQQHNVVGKYRPALSVTTHYERQVINSALELCKLDARLEIERKLGWLRLRVVSPTIYGSAGHRQLRAA